MAESIYNMQNGQTATLANGTWKGTLVKRQDNDLIGLDCGPGTYIPRWTGIFHGSATTMQVENISGKPSLRTAQDKLTFIKGMCLSTKRLSSKRLLEVIDS